MRFALVCSLLFFSTCLHAQVDSMRIYCEKQIIASLEVQDMLWMYRQRDTLRNTNAAGNLNLFLNGQRVSLSDSVSLRYLASIAAAYPALDSIWRPVLNQDIELFKQQKDSLQAKINALGWTMRYLQTTRNLRRQQQLNASGRSQVLLSFHNFQLAADVGLYARKRYLKRSPRYLRLGQEAKLLGMTWGGDFVGFPDPGHVQRLMNSSVLIDRYPSISFEFERYRDVYQSVYQAKRSAGRLDLVRDTEALLVSMNRQRIGKVCACQYAIMPISNEPFDEDARVEVNTRQNWVLIKPRGGNAYYYSLGRWVYKPKN